ncbi:MAG: ElyC/SanA/YdcF family protein [Patescibacteria group bacterium]
MDSAKKEFKKLYDLGLNEQPQKADIIVWLQGDRYDRANKVLGLYKQDWSKKILISGNNILIGGKRLGEDNITLKQMEKFLLKEGIKSKQLIINDKSLNTKEQAEYILKLAKIKKWKKILLVGSSYYQPRAFLTFLKQAKKIKWNGVIINQPAIITWMKNPSGRNKTARLIFKEEFEKIKKYKKDLASISEGIKYLYKSYEG